MLQIKKMVKEMGKIYARLRNQRKFEYQTVFTARIDKLYEVVQVSVEIDIFFSLNIMKNITESDFDIFIVRSQREKISESRNKD